MDLKAGFHRWAWYDHALSSLSRIRASAGVKCVVCLRIDGCAEWKTEVRGLIAP